MEPKPGIPLGLTLSFSSYGGLDFSAALTAPTYFQQHKDWLNFPWFKFLIPKEETDRLNLGQVSTPH